METKTFEDFIEESTAGFKYKVRSTGKKRRKKICPPGMKPSESGTSCVPMQASEKRARKLGSRKTQRTIRARGAALKTRALRKRRKAMRFRKSYGLS